MRCKFLGYFSIIIYKGTEITIYTIYTRNNVINN